jgi:hypothetical protein
MGRGGLPLGWCGMCRTRELGSAVRGAPNPAAGCDRTEASDPTTPDGGTGTHPSDAASAPSSAIATGRAA